MVEIRVSPFLVSFSPLWSNVLIDHQLFKNLPTTKMQRHQSNYSPAKFPSELFLSSRLSSNLIAQTRPANHRRLLYYRSVFMTFSISYFLFFISYFSCRHPPLPLPYPPPFPTSLFTYPPPPPRMPAISPKPSSYNSQNSSCCKGECHWGIFYPSSPLESL